MTVAPSSRDEDGETTRRDNAVAGIPNESRVHTSRHRSTHLINRREETKKHKEKRNKHTLSRLGEQAPFKRKNRDKGTSKTLHNETRRRRWRFP